MRTFFKSLLKVLRMEYENPMFLEKTASFPVVVGLEESPKRQFHLSQSTLTSQTKSTLYLSPVPVECSSLERLCLYQSQGLLFPSRALVV